MERRDFVTSVLVGGLMTPVIGDRVAADNDQREEQDEHHHGGKHDEKSTNFTVSFGHWSPTPTNSPTQTESPIDRLSEDPLVQNPRFLNGHEILPNNLRIRVGDTVTFAISGFHLLMIYRRTRPEDIDRTRLIISPPIQLTGSIGVSIPGRSLRIASKWWGSTREDAISSRAECCHTSSTP
jgi:hypothetical protein